MVSTSVSVTVRQLNFSIEEVNLVSNLMLFQRWKEN